MLTACDGRNNYLFEGVVDPLTRNVDWSIDDLLSITNLFNSAYRLLFHNTNFDLRAISTIGINISPYWPKIEDTLVASHVLCSGDVHGLKDLAIKYLDYWDDDEQQLQQIITSTRERLRNIPQDSPDFVCIAREGHPHFPASRNAKYWKQDLWLNLPACRVYATKDVERTWLLWKAFHIGMLDDHLVPQYRFRMDLLPILYDMQTTGINIYINKLDRLLTHLAFQREQLRLLIQTSSNFPGILDPEKSSHLQLLLYKILHLDVINSTPPSTTFPQGQPSTDDATLTLLEEVYDNLPAIQYLRIWREVNTEFKFLTSYKAWSVEQEIPQPFSHTRDSSEQRQFLQQQTISNRSIEQQSTIGQDSKQQIPPPRLNSSFDLQIQNQSSTTSLINSSSTGSSNSPDLVHPINSLSTNLVNNPVVISNPLLPSTQFRLHSSLNLTGTHWTRQSSSDPNQQNFKKALAFLFGPPPGYYWLHFDLSNIELRIWAYEVGSPQLIEAFNRGESVHMIIARIIRPHQIYAYPGATSLFQEKAWKAADPIHKQYTKTKGGTFAGIYGGSEAKIDKTYGIPGAFAKIKSYIPEIPAYFKHLEFEMRRLQAIYGYPTIFTRDFDNHSGYRLDVPITKQHTVPSGRIQGTAAIIIQDMMRKIIHHPTYKDPINPYSTLRSITLNPPTPCRMIQQVHDSLTLEIPQHDSYLTTNQLLLQEFERIGRTHLPTCPLDSSVTFPTPDESFSVRIYLHLPEYYTAPINDLNPTPLLHKLTYFFNKQWICEVESDDDTFQVTGSTREEARQNAITNIEIPF